MGLGMSCFGEGVMNPFTIAILSVFLPIPTSELDHHLELPSYAFALADSNRQNRLDLDLYAESKAESSSIAMLIESNPPSIHLQLI